MDSLITAAALALAAGNPIGALQRVALRSDPQSLALRGIAMAQLGELARAKALLREAARGFGPRQTTARARCAVAEAEIALVSRDLAWPTKALAAARATLERRGDHANAAHAGILAARRQLLLGQFDDAERTLAGIGTVTLPPALRAGHALVMAGLAIRRLKTAAARKALVDARAAARAARIPALAAEVENAARMMSAPAARLIDAGAERLLRLAEVEALLASGTLVVDACRNVVRAGSAVVPLTTRPVLFALARAMAEAWPGDVSRGDLLRRAFGARDADEHHRARLRVEVGRLRAELRPLAGVNATGRGFILSPRDGRGVAVLAPPIDERHAAVLAFLADGEAWSSSALAMALGTSPRTVQRALEALASDGKVEAFGRGRARRWTTPSVPGFPTALLLPGPLPGS